MVNLFAKVNKKNIQKAKKELNGDAEEFLLYKKIFGIIQKRIVTFWNNMVIMKAPGYRADHKQNTNCTLQSATYKMIQPILKINHVIGLLR